MSHKVFGLKSNLFVAVIVLQINNATAAYWVATSNNTITDNAIRSGNDKGNLMIYTCRAWYNSDLVPGKLTDFCSIAYNGQEVKLKDYYVASGHGSFVPTTGSKFQLPVSAVEGGIATSKLKLLYVCRAAIEGQYVSVGKLEDEKCWISYGGGQQSFAFGTYDILIHED